MKIGQNKIILIFLFLTLVLAGLVFWYFNRNIYSKETLKVEILAPEEVEAGEEVRYTLKYKNNGNARLEDAEFVFEFPEGSMTEEGEQRIKESIDDIYPGEEKTREFNAYLFGKKGDVRTARASITYRPKNLRAVYESGTSFSTRISEAPITFVFDAPSKIPLDKEAKISLNYYSNLDTPLYDIGVKVHYPEGFVFSSSRPDGIEKGEWQIGVLNPAEGGKIEIYGKMAEEIGTQSVFKAELGVWVGDRFILLKEISRGTEVAQPEIMISQTINGFSEYKAAPGDLLHYEIIFRNIGSSYFEDMFLVSKLSGPFNFSTLRTQDGEATADNQSIVWDWRTNPELRYLGPGEEGSVEFWINLKQGEDMQDIRRPVVNNHVSVAQVEQKFETKVSSRLVLEQKGYFKDEVFGNSGPIPPQVDEKTTYTVMWQLKNLHNDLENVKVRATLPSGVKPTGNVFPEELASDFAFDSGSREALWNVGDVEAGTGVDSPILNLSFQIEFRPQEGQKGLVVPLVNDAVVSGEDQWADKEVKFTASAIDTSLPDDNSIGPEDGIVE